MLASNIPWSFGFRQSSFSVTLPRQFLSEDRRMQAYDIIMLAVLAGSTLFGFVKGMAWQLASLSSLFVSYFVALNFSHLLAPYVGKQEPLNRIAAMLILYLASSLAIWLIFRVVAGFIDRSRSSTARSAVCSAPLRACCFVSWRRSSRLDFLRTSASTF
jgi:hypothetical protein